MLTHRPNCCQLRRWWAICGLVLFAVTWRLWVPQAVFPQVPLFRWASALPSAVDWLCFGSMIVALLAATGGLTPNGTDFTRKVAGTFHVPSPNCRVSAHGMCLLLSKVSAIGLTPPRSPQSFETTLRRITGAFLNHKNEPRGQVAPWVRSVHSRVRTKFFSSCDSALVQICRS